MNCLTVLLSDVSTDFLGTNGTFLGVILTLNVLCLFYEKSNSSNFILRILLEQWGKFKNSLDSLQKSITKDLLRFQSGEKYQTISNITSGKETCTDGGSYQFALQLQFRFDNAIQNLKTDLTDCIMKMDRIESSNEQLRAPFFTLLFGLTIFSIDLISSWSGTEGEKLILPCVWTFTLLSIVYWAAIWTAFCRRSMDEDTSSAPADKTFTAYIKKIGWKRGSCFKIAFCAIIAAVTLGFGSLNTLPQFLEFSIVAALLLLIICIIGVWRVVSCGVKGKYSAMHTLGHVAAFFVYSTILGAIYDWLGNGACDALFNSKDALNGCIVFFALINGIICPFVLPYYKYRAPYIKMMDDLNESKATLDSAINLFNGGFNEWTAQKFLAERQKEKDEQKS